MRKLLIAAMLAALVPAAFADGASAQSRSDDTRRRAEDAIREGAEKILHGFEQMLRSIPQYDMPEVQPNGDIVIRRRPPKHPAEKAPNPDNDQSRT